MNIPPFRRNNNTTSNARAITIIITMVIPNSVPFLLKIIYFYVVWRFNILFNELRSNKAKIIYFRD